MALGAAVVLQVAIIYALATGLAQQMVEKLPDDIKADIVKEKPPEQPKTPPPPPPDMVKPPPPFIPPPDIVVSNEPTVNTITQVTNQVAPPPKPAVTSPASIGRPHTCGQRYYPALATRLGHEGTTTLSFKIGADGSVKDVKVVGSSGYQELDDAAIPCAQNWQYKPALQNGQPVEVPWEAKVTWRLNGG
ncbi:MAG TPA: energy transducer TonB [Rhizomicrobium sp.]|nr:energy transducer TonB [Rhizomicrobium sp.]